MSGYMSGLVKDTIAYIKTFIEDRNVASIMPSSKFLVRRVCRRMDFSERRVVVEYGPGLGVFSEYILKQMGPEDRLLLIEANPKFVDKLRKLAAGDPRVEVYHEKAQNVEEVLEAAGELAADYVLSGIPFSFLDEEVKHELIDTTKSILKPGGKFLVYQHYNHMEEPLNEHFEHVEKDFQLLNIPPIHIHSAVKQ